MTNIIMYGCNGKMGQVITRIVAEDPDAEIVAGIDLTGEVKNDYPVFRTIEECNVEGDVIIDFPMPPLWTLCWRTRDLVFPVVLCTTGLSAEQLELVSQVSKETAVLKSANMSMGINTILKLVREAAKVLANAVMIWKCGNASQPESRRPQRDCAGAGRRHQRAMDHQYHYQYDRTQVHAKRDPKEIGIQAVRGGSIVGDHQVLFCGPDEVVEIRHTAYSRSIFAKGAVQAAKFLKGKEAGMYDMSDVIAAF